MKTVRVQPGIVDDHITATLERKHARAELVSAWQQWRAAARAHTAAKQAAGVTPYLGRDGGRRLDAEGLGLPTFTAAAHARDTFLDLAATARPTPTAHAYVAKMGGGYEAVCPAHPRFRRVAWTHRATPALSAHEHNTEHHDGARVIVVEAPGREPSSLLP